MQTTFLHFKMTMTTYQSSIFKLLISHKTSYRSCIFFWFEDRYTSFFLSFLHRDSRGKSLSMKTYSRWCCPHSARARHINKSSTRIECQILSDSENPVADALMNILSSAHLCHNDPTRYVSWCPLSKPDYVQSPHLHTAKLRKVCYLSSIPGHQSGFPHNCIPTLPQTKLSIEITLSYTL